MHGYLIKMGKFKVSIDQNNKAIFRAIILKKVRKIVHYVYGVIGVQIENAFAPNYFEIPPNQSPGPTSF